MYSCDSCQEKKDEHIFVSSNCHNCLKTLKRHSSCKVKSCSYIANVPCHKSNVCEDCLIVCDICQDSCCKKFGHSVKCTRCSIDICFGCVKWDPEELDDAHCPKCNAWLNY